MYLKGVSIVEDKTQVKAVSGRGADGHYELVWKSEGSSLRYTLYGCKETEYIYIYLAEQTYRAKRIVYPRAQFTLYMAATLFRESSTPYPLGCRADPKSSGTWNLLSHAR